MKKILLGIIAILAIGAGAWVILRKVPANAPLPEVNAPEIIPGARSLRYENKEFGFALRYPEGADVREGNAEGFLSATARNAVVGIFLPQPLFQGTNLGEAAVAVGVSPDPDALAHCATSSGTGEVDRGTATIGGETFHEFSATGVGAGNIYESTSYRVERRGGCYEIVEMLHSGNIGNYTPGTVKEFDKEKFSKILDALAHTFVFTEGASGGVIGAVQLGPTCPVERIPPEPQCAPRPYQTAIAILRAGSSSVLKTIESDADGRFKTDLGPGSYELRPKGGATLPRCTPQTVEIQPQSFAYVALSCDTGIR